MTEPHFDLVECFDRERNTCPIEGACGLKGVLRQARARVLRCARIATRSPISFPRAPALLQLWLTRGKAGGKTRRAEL